jgi:hypothetical protein
MKSYRELEVWKRGIDMVVVVHALSKKFPADEKYGLQSQLRVPQFLYLQISQKAMAENIAKNISIIYRSHKDR